MRAIRIHAFGDSSVLKLEEIDAPAPGPRQVLVDVKAIGVNPVDTYIRSGTYGQRDLPYTPGFDAAGIVEAIGAGVERFKAGARVYVSRTLSGAYAEKTLVDEASVYALPANVAFAQGAAIGVPYGTAYRGLFHRAQARPGETVLVHGATGGVGIAAVQLGAAVGMSIIGTGGSDAGRKLVLEQGARHVLDHHDAAYLKALMKLTGDRGVDVILEMLANVNLANDLTVLAKFGRVVVIGNRGTIEINPRDTMGRDADIRGMTLMNATPGELASIHAAIYAGLSNKTLRPIIDKELPLAQAARAQEEVLEGDSHGKIVLVP
jgi:NADPH2:quinone reductase